MVRDSYRDHGIPFNMTTWGLKLVEFESGAYLLMDQVEQYKKDLHERFLLDAWYLESLED
jgi:hypothetical protein